MLIHVVVLHRTAQKPTRLYFARAVSMCSLLALLLGGVLHDVVVLQRTAEKPTRLYFARAVSMCSSLAILLGGIPYNVAVVVSLKFPLCAHV